MGILNSLGLNTAPSVDQIDFGLPLRDPQKPGQVEVDILPGKPGRVKFAGTTWPAKSIQEILIEHGCEVCVVGRTGVTLLVIPAHGPPLEKEYEYATVYQQA